MKIIITPAEAQVLAENLSPLLLFIDVETNKKLSKDSPRSNLALDMYEDTEKYFHLGYETIDTGFTIISNSDGNLVIDLKPEMVMEFTKIYLKSTLELIKPMMVLIPLMKAQNKIFETFSKKWSLKQD